MISIHALREEGDRRTCTRRQQIPYFYPRPPRGGRRISITLSLQIWEFLSTPSARRATFCPFDCTKRCDISIHALREEGDKKLFCINGFVKISIHALREEGDKCHRKCSPLLLHFYPRPPRGGRHSRHIFLIPCKSISIHALREEGDLSLADEIAAAYEFLSTPSARRATLSGFFYDSHHKFLSTPSARRATAKTETKSLFSNKLYNILHEFRRALIYNGSKSYPNHAK